MVQGFEYHAFGIRANRTHIQNGFKFGSGLYWPTPSSGNSAIHSHNSHIFIISLWQKRGVIWNKIKKVKKGIWSAKKKLWRIKEKAVEIVIGNNFTLHFWGQCHILKQNINWLSGKDHATPKPYYESTGGSWGHYQKQVPKRQSLSLKDLAGPPYAASDFKGVLFPISAGSTVNGWSKNKSLWPRNANGSSTKLTYADLLAIYRLPLNLDALHRLKKMGVTSRLRTKP